MTQVAEFEEFALACGPRLRRLCSVLVGDPVRAEQLLVDVLAATRLSWSRIRDHPEAHARMLVAQEFAGPRCEPALLLRSYDEVVVGVPALVGAPVLAGVPADRDGERLADVRRLLVQRAGQVDVDEVAGPPDLPAVRREVRLTRTRRGTALGLLVALLACLAVALPAVGSALVAPDDSREGEAALPVTLGGRERLAFSDVDLGTSGRLAVVSVVPASLDLALAVGCDGTTDVVDILVVVNGRYPSHQTCTGSGVDQRSAGGDTYEDYWHALGVRAGQPVTVTAAAVTGPGSEVPLLEPLPGIHLALGVYGAPPPVTRLPAGLPGRPAGVPAGARLVARLDLGTGLRTSTIDAVPGTRGPFLLAVACAGPADSYGYRTDIGGVGLTRVSGGCSAGARTITIGEAAARAAGVTPGRPLVLTGMMTTTPERPDILTGPLHAGTAVRVWLYERPPGTGGRE
jgi:hypothetical protein